MLSLLFHHKTLIELLIWPSRRSPTATDPGTDPFDSKLRFCIIWQTGLKLWPITACACSGISYNDNTASTEPSVNQRTREEALFSLATQEQAQEQQFLIHSVNGFYTRTRSEAITSASRSKLLLFLVLALVLASTFSRKKETWSWKSRNIEHWAVFLSTNQSTRSEFVSWIYRDDRGRRKFEERVSYFYGVSVFCYLWWSLFFRYKEFVLSVSALVIIPPSSEFRRHIDLFLCQFFSFFI